MKNAKRGGGKFKPSAEFSGQSVKVPSVMVALCLFSDRNYTVPDPPGLFDGHVWPMYLKHKNIMEVSGDDICKYPLFFRLPVLLPVCVYIRDMY